MTRFFSVGPLTTWFHLCKTENIQSASELAIAHTWACADVNELGAPLKMADFFFSTAHDYIYSDIGPLANTSNFCLFYVHKQLCIEESYQNVILLLIQYGYS